MNFRDIAQRVLDIGPINLYLSESEYEALKRAMRALWQHPSWAAEDRRLALAFLRGYTFYREPSEYESRFWQGFHSELGLDQGLPSPTQYDNLWRAFKENPQLAPLLAYDGRGRAFVTTIDAVWGIRSLRAQALTNFFVKYYLEYPGIPITRDLMQRILPDPDEAVLRQADAYDRIFRAMNRVISVVLEYDLEELPIDQLEAELVARGIDLGQPNALRYFFNKSSGALNTILGQLRFQRTPRQFQRYLQRFPSRRFRLPDGTSRLGSDLFLSVLAYGRYLDVSAGEEHFVVPATRVSLQMLENLPLETFSKLSGFTAYVGRSPFPTRVGDADEASVPLYTGFGLRHLWLGQARRGRLLQIKGAFHPDSIGWEAEATTRLAWSPVGPRLQGVLDLSTCLPQERAQLTVNAGGEAFGVLAMGQNQRLVFDLPITGMEVHFESFTTWTWAAGDRLFSVSGSEVKGSFLKHGPKTLYLLAQVPQVLSATGVDVEPIEGSLPLWRIRWDGKAPLSLNRWVVEAPFRMLQHRLGKASRRKRSDINVTLQEGTYEQGDRIEIELQGAMPVDAALAVGNRKFASQGRTFWVDGLSPGTYVPELLQDDEVVAELDAIRVIPPVSWEFPKDTVLVQGHTYASRVFLADGRFETFRWKPQRDLAGQPVRSVHEITLDDFVLPFEMEATCFMVHCLNPRSGQLVETLRGLNSDTLELKAWNPYDRDLPLRLRLASTPALTVTPSELARLKPTSRDQAIVEVCTDKRSDLWTIVTRAAVHIKPIVSGFKVESGYCFLNLSGPRDVTLQLEERETRSGKSVVREIAVSPEQMQRIRLLHPEKLQPILVLLRVSTESESDEEIWLQQVTKPLFDLQSSIRRGVGWSFRN